MYQKRHYESMAAAIRESQNKDLVEAIIDVFRADNPRFNEERFRKAAGLLGGNTL